MVRLLIEECNFLKKKVEDKLKMNLVNQIDLEQINLNKITANLKKIFYKDCF